MLDGTRFEICRINIRSSLCAPMALRDTTLPLGRFLLPPPDWHIDSTFVACKSEIITTKEQQN